MPKLSGEGGRGGHKRKRRRGGSGGAQHGAPGALRDKQTHGGTTTHTVPLSDGSGTYTPPKPPGWVIRRQRLLRQAGFNVPVDGQWGVRSQRAWDRLNDRIGNADGLTGQQMVARSRLSQQIDQARTDASKAIRQAKLAATRRSLTFSQPAAQHGAPVALGQSRKDFDQNAGLYFVWQENQKIMQRLTGTTLHRGGTQVAGVRTLRQAAEQGRITGDDLRFLGDHAFLRVDRPEDVRVTQIALNHLLKDRKVAVTGEWDVETAKAMRDFIVQDERRKYLRALKWTQHNLVRTGIAARVTRDVTGKPVTDAATVIAMLSQDTPMARRLARRISIAYEHELEDRRLLAIKDERVADLAGVGPGDNLFGGLYGPDTAFVLGSSSDPFDRALGRSHTLRQFARNATNVRNQLIEEERKAREEQMRLARHEPAMWQQVVGKAVDIVSWSGEQGAKFALTWSDTSLRNQTGGSFHFEGPLGGVLDFAGGAIYNHGRYGNPAQNIDESWHRAEITLATMPWWERLIYESAFDPLNLVGTGLVTGGIKAGLRVGSRGIVRTGDFLLADHIAGTLGVTTTRALHGRLFDAAFKTHLLSETLDLSHPIRRSFGAGGRAGYKIVTAGPYGREVAHAWESSRLYQMASITRADAAAKVALRKREFQSSIIRRLAFGRVTRTVGSAFDKLAARQEALAGLLDPEARARLDTLVFHQQRAMRDLAPDLVNEMASWGTSLYSHYLREGGTTSFAGTRVMARMAERISRGITTRLLILEDLAARGVTDDVSSLSIGQLRAYYEHAYGAGKLNTLLQEAGSYKAGHVAYRLIEDFEQHRRVAMERVYDLILPTLDDLVREKVGDSIWHLGDDVQEAVKESDAALTDLRETLTAAGTERSEAAARIWQDFLDSEADEGDQALELADRIAAGKQPDTGKEVGVLLRDEADDDIRDSLDRFFGYDVATVYNPRHWVEFKNPNYAVRVTEQGKEFLASAEKERVSESILRWGETVKRAGGITDPQEIARIDAAVARRIETRHRYIEWAWKPHNEGGWMDTRKVLRAPGPTVRNIEQATSSPALDQLDRLADAIVDFDLLANPRQAGLLLAPARAAAIQKVADDPAMRQWAFESEEFNRIAKAQKDKVASHFYYQERLYLSGLRYSQAIPARMLYFFLAKMLNMWKSAVLAFRPAFPVRNTLDNFSKIFLEGLRDPALFFNPSGKSIFEVAMIRPLLGAAKFFDRLFGTSVAVTFGLILDGFWRLPRGVVQRVLGVHGIDLPDEVVDDLRTMKSVFDDPAAEESTKGFTKEMLSDVDQQLRDRLLKAPRRTAKWIGKVDNVMWDLMAGRPENYARRILYVSQYRQALRRGLDKTEATGVAVEAVDRALFDYSKVTVLEENLKVFFPFIFFWRKNANFWLHHLEDKPWFFVQANRLYQEHEASNGDMAEWMRRYWTLAPVASLTDLVPGFGWLSGWLRDANVDPFSYVSVNQFYNAFKEGNKILPADREGSWKFVSKIVDGFNLTAGLGINPFISDAGQRLGLLNQRAWQDIFPQTTVLQALTSKGWLRDVLGVDSPEGFNIEDQTFGRIYDALAGGPTAAELTRDRFDELVNQEMAEQRARGETVSRDRATRRVQSMYAFQTLMGFTIGLYPRFISKEARNTYTLMQQMRDTYLDPDLTLEEATDQTTHLWNQMTPDEQDAYRLFRHKGYSPEAFDKYRRGLEAAAVYYEIDDYDEKQQWLSDHPEAAIIVHPELSKRYSSEQYLQTQILLSRTDAVSSFANAYLKSIGAPADVKQAAYSTLVTPSLRRFWRQNDTPQEIRERQLRGSFFRYIDGVQNVYFTIPADDFDGKQQYLDRHPELLDYWRINDGATDDFRAIYRNANASFRTIYFHFVDQGDWDSAEEFLRRHPFIFDYTSAEGRIAGGRFIPSSEHQADYAQVADQLRIYWSLPADKRDDYGRSNPGLLKYLKKYGASDGMYAQAVEYDKLQPILAQYFRLPVGLREAYLNRHPELRAYFAKYAHDRTLSQHARDYLAIKGLLDQFFALPDSERQAFLRRHPEVQAYFDKYAAKGKNAHSGGSFEGKLRIALAQNPEVAERYEFWQTFFALPPNKRPAFIHHHAEAAGVFIYGSLSYQQQQHQIALDHRMAVRLGLSDKQYLYRKVAPMLDLYFDLPEGSGERAIFLQTNPDLARYLDVYAKKTPISDPKLARLVERYFLLPAFGADRADFIERHPELRRYFNRDASPREKAMQRLIDRFFKLPYGPSRDRFLASHPELKHYFDQRDQEHSNFEDLAAAFNEADPRMEQFREMYADIVPLGAIKQWVLQRQRADEIVQAPSREDAGRQPDDGEDGALTRRRSRARNVS